MAEGVQIGPERSRARSVRRQPLTPGWMKYRRRRRLALRSRDTIGIGRHAFSVEQSSWQPEPMLATAVTSAKFAVIGADWRSEVQGMEMCTLNASTGVLTRTNVPLKLSPNIFLC